MGRKKRVREEGSEDDAWLYGEELLPDMSKNCSGPLWSDMPQMTPLCVHVSLPPHKESRQQQIYKLRLRCRAMSSEIDLALCHYYQRHPLK